MSDLHETKIQEMATAIMDSWPDDHPIPIPVSPREPLFDGDTVGYPKMGVVGVNDMWNIEARKMAELILYNWPLKRK